VKVALLRDYDEERLFGVRLYADRLCDALRGRCEIEEVRPAPRRATGPRLARALQTFVVKEIFYPMAARRVVADVAHVVDQSHAHLARWIRGAPTVVTCHDLWGLRFGGPLRRWGYRRRVSALSTAARVVTVSESTRRGAIALGVDPQRIVVVRNRVDRFFLEPPHASELAAMRARLGDGAQRSVLHVGNTLPYKNVEGLLRALGEIRRGDGREVVLVKAGAPLTSSQQALAARELVSVRFLGEVSRAELRALYHVADCVVYPSFEEGFGWPVGEAIACGRPVVAAASGALPEVAGDAALLVDVERPGDLAAAILRVLDDGGFRDHLADLARQRGSWLTEGDFGGEMAEVYRHAAEERRGR